MPLMKKILPLLILLLIVLIVVPLLRQQESPRKQMTDLPWQVEVLPGGYSKVFGLKLGQSTFNDALNKLGHDMELAIIAETDEDGSLEMYYSRFMAGMLSGKLILGTEMDKSELLRLQDRAISSKVLESGSRKFTLAREDLPTAYEATIDSITFIPAVDIDAKVADVRFGPPAERIQLSKQIEHFLYPDIGLDLIINHKGKEILQYVAPRAFDRLRDPLEKAAAAATGKAAGNPTD